MRYVISEKCAKTSVSEVARQYGLNEATVRRIDREFLCKRSLITPARTCRILGIDEIALRKVHVCKYAADALDEVRRSEYSRQADKTDFDLKRGRFLLQKAAAKLDEKGRARIEKLKEINEDVYTAYLLKEQVFTFYEHATREDAEAFLKSWSSACLASELPAFVKLGRRLLRNAESILAYFVHRVSNAFAEGINNGIKVVKRIAFGFHDFEYFKLKILAYTGYLKPYPAPNVFCDD